MYKGLISAWHTVSIRVFVFVGLGYGGRVEGNKIKGHRIQFILQLSYTLAS